MENENSGNLAAQMIYVALDQIHVPAHLMRSTIDQARVVELSESIAANGLINPLSVIKTNDGFELVAGYRRLMACRLLRWEVVVCHVLVTENLDSEIIKIHENLVRDDVDPISEGIYYCSIVEKYGVKQKDLARMINKSDAYISERMQTKEWPVSLRNAVMSDQISFSAARELARIRDLATFEHYFQTGLNNGITPAVAKEWANYANAQPSPDPITNETRQEDYEPRVIQMPSFPCMSCACVCEVQEMQMIRVCGNCAKAFRESSARQSFVDDSQARYDANQLDLLGNQPPR